MSTRLRLHAPALFTVSPLRLALAWLFVLSAGLPGLAPSRVHADATPSLIVLRDDRGRLAPDLVRDVDQRLVQALAEKADIIATLSPSPFEEVALMADCGKSRSSACVAAISRALETEWILVRQLRSHAGGEVRLSLVAHDGRDASASRKASATWPQGQQVDLARLLPSMVAQLYPGSPQGPRLLAASSPEHPRQLEATSRSRAEGVSAQSSAPSSVPSSAVVGASTRAREREGRGTDYRRVLGWTSLGLSGVLLTSGLVVGAHARRDETAYSELRIQSADDAMRAQELWSRADKRADYANGLLISSGITAAVGVAMLVWRGVSEKRAAPVQVAAVPNRNGASLILQGSLSGGM
jgi:hypothetical protein